MLILNRRVGESVMIGEGVTVTILSIRGNQARVGINAPRKIPVHREEVYERIRREQEREVSRRLNTELDREQLSGTGPE